MKWFSNILIQFYRGLKDSINSINITEQVITQSNTLNIFINIITYNILICLITNLILSSLFDLAILYFRISRNLQILLILLQLVLWNIPHYIFGNIYNNYYTNQCISVFIKNNKPDNINLRYICYEKYSQYLVNKGYYQIIIIFLTLETIFVSYIPYIGKYIDWFLTSLIYSYYNWEYSWSSHKIPHQSRYQIFENNIFYYLGYGTILGSVKINMSFFNSYYLLSVIFPIQSINTLVLYDSEYHTLKSINNNYLPLFHLPIYYANNVIILLTKYIKKQICYKDTHDIK